MAIHGLIIPDEKIFLANVYNVKMKHPKVLPTAFSKNAKFDLFQIIYL